MRKLHGVLVLLALAACGGGSSVSPNPAPPPPPPPPPAPPGPPASITVQQGDGQAGDPGAVLPTRPAVIVRDASGRAVPGVSVTFAVDSGGGAVAGGAVFSGADGIATAGPWTLGPAEGRNVLLVSSAGVTPVRFGANAAIQAAEVANTSVGTAGGSVVVNRPGLPLDGLRLDVPAGAFPAPVQVAVTVSSSSGMPHAAGLTLGSPIITLTSTATGPASDLYTIRIPAKIGDDEYPIVAMVDPVTGFLDALPTVDYDQNGITAATTLVDESQVIQSAPGSALRVAAGGMAGAATSARMRLAVLLAKISALHTIQYDTHFLPGVDDWEFPGDATPVFSATDAGQVVSERYYFRTRKSQASGSLYTQMEKAPGATGSDVSGYQWSAGLAKQFHSLIPPYIKGAINAHIKNQVKYDRTTIQWIVMSFIASGGAPQTVLFVDGSTMIYHPVLAYRWDGPAGQLLDANPQFPGDVARGSTWNTNGLVCVTYCDVVVGINHLIGYQTQLNAEWPQVASGTINRGLFPQAFMSSHSAIIGPGSSGPVGSDTLFMAEDTTRIWVECVSCAGNFSTTLPLQHGAAGIQAQQIYTEGTPGHWARYTNGQSNTGFFIDLAQFPTPGNNRWADFQMGVEGRGLISTNIGPQMPTGWLGWKQYRVMKYSPALTFNQSAPNGPVTVTLSINGGPPLPANLTYLFKWNDGTSNTTFPTKPATVQHTFPQGGDYTVDLEIRHPHGNELVGKTSAVTTASGIQVWRLTQLNVDHLLTPGALLPSTGASFADAGGITNSDHVTWYKADSALIKRLTTNPSTGLLVYLGNPVVVAGTTYRAGLYLQSDPTGTPGKPGTFDPTQVLIPLALSAGPPFADVYAPPLLGEPYANALTASPTNISGSSIVQIRDFTNRVAILVAPQTKRVLLAWDVNAARTGTTLSGTLDRTQSLWVFLPASAAHGMYWYNLFTYQLSFSATRVN